MSHLLLETCCSETNRKYFAARYHDQGFEKEMNRECQQIGETVRKPKNDEKRSTESTSIGTSLGKVPIYPCLLDFTVF